MPALNETVVTKEEFPDLVEETLLHLLQDSPTVKYQLRGMMVGVFAEKTDLQAILERIDAQGERIEKQGERIEALREDFNRQFAEHAKRMDHFAEVQAEHSKRMDHFAEVQAEHARKIEALREDFNRGFALLSKRIDGLSDRVDGLARNVKQVDSRLGALGARWGLESESAFRDGLTAILAEETGLKVKRYLAMDTEGMVFGRPDQVEIDVAIQDGEHTLIEIKSSVSRQDVHAFDRKTAFYEQQENVTVKRKIIISPFFGPDAEALADELAIETYTSAYNVKA
jgi:hypothetical protein